MSQKCERQIRSHFFKRTLPLFTYLHQGRGSNAATVTSQGVSASVKLEHQTVANIWRWHCCKYYANISSISKGLQNVAKTWKRTAAPPWIFMRTIQTETWIEWTDAPSSFMFFKSTCMRRCPRFEQRPKPDLFFGPDTARNEHQKRLRSIGVNAQDLDGLATDAVFVGCTWSYGEGEKLCAPRHSRAQCQITKASREGFIDSFNYLRKRWPGWNGNNI